jgi:hypothetical protein
MRVLSLNHQTGQLELQPSSGGFPKGTDYLHQIQCANGEFRATSHHRIFSSDHKYQPLGDLLESEDRHKIGLSRLSLSPDQTIAAVDRLLSHEDVENYSQIDADYLSHYGVVARLCGQLLLQSQDIAQDIAPSIAYAHEYISDSAFSGDGPLALEQERNHLDQFVSLPSKKDYVSLVEELVEVLANQNASLPPERISQFLRRVRRFHPTFALRRKEEQLLLASHSMANRLNSQSPLISSFLTPMGLVDEHIIACSTSESPEEFWDIQVLNNNNYVTAGGFVHHNSGKTEALVYRALKFMTEIPKVELGIYQPTVDLPKSI